jgi:hypothetical protein
MPVGSISTFSRASKALLREAERRWHKDRFYRFANYHDWSIPYKTRVAVLTRARDHCEGCGRHVNEYGSARLDLHHLTYDRRGKEKPGDLLALCRDCHRRVHCVASVSHGVAATSRESPEINENKRQHDAT